MASALGRGYAGAAWCEQSGEFPNAGQVPAGRLRQAGVLRIGVRRAVPGSRPIFVRRMRVCQATKIYPELTSPCSSANNVTPARVETPTLAYKR